MQKINNSTIEGSEGLQERKINLKKAREGSFYFTGALFFRTNIKLSPSFLAPASENKETENQT